MFLPFKLTSTNNGRFTKDHKAGGKSQHLAQESQQRSSLFTFAPVFKIKRGLKQVSAGPVSHVG